MCGGGRCHPQLLQDPVTAPGHYLQAAGGLLAAVAGDVAANGGADAAEPELHICYAAEGGEAAVCKGQEETKKPPCPVRLDERTVHVHS